MSENAYEPLLSTDETDALLQAMRSNGAAVTSAKEVELGSAEQRLRKSLGRADEVAREWATEVRKLLRRMLGVSASVRESQADIIPYSVMAQSIAPGAGVCVLRTEEGALGFLVMGPGLTSFVLNRRLGGGADQVPGQADDVRSFLSAVDRRIVRPFCEEVVAALIHCWGEDEVAIAVSEVLARPIELPRMGQFEPLMRLPLSVSFGMDSNEELIIVLSGTAIQLPKADEKPPEPVNTGDRERMVARLTLAELELVVVLGRANTSVRDVLALSVGDVLRLEEAPTAPLQVYVEGQRKMYGAPVISHGNIAVEVTHVLKGVP
jgi:flagellar motor switch protein FliM